MTKQTIVGRVGQLARADIGALLDQAEDEHKMADQLIRDYADTVREGEQAVADAVGGLRLMEQDHAEDVAAAVQWGGKAAQASTRADELRSAGRTVEADRFDTLARVALGRQLHSEREAAAGRSPITAQSETVDRLRAGLDRCKERLERLRAHRDELVVRSRTAPAPARGTVLDTVREIDVLDPTSDLGRFEEKVRREEVRSQGRQDLPASALDGQFESLEVLEDDPEVSTRLARLKSPANR
ncbi:PspA/IM30 family protein [Actinacidiphila yeochonensis]|uniref:PspA/IM30 family protein n=1 Tax=Actinacidiphila yeochonensis TaxID=89050 RepID=UPI00055E248C|nr:PspA/IM30 family protein [Actinacidiphila yeochonensis]